jgi:serine/threonine-protein kinase
MAEIYRAKTYDESGRSLVVAIKRLLSQYTEDPDFVAMLLDEARICGALRHPNIAQVFEFARAGGEYFIAMEHVDGKDGRAILERARKAGGPIPTQHCAYLAAGVADGLAAAHSQRDADGKPLAIIHRDVSPSNVLASYQGMVKLCDFGIAKATTSRVQTKAGVIKGKARYMSPEQAMGKKLDARSDLFSLGVVLYELLTGVPPFQAETEMEMLFRVRDARYKPVRAVAPDVPEALESIVDRCLERSRDARYQSAAELSTALRTYLRRQVPAYNRSHLARYMRELFEVDMAQEQRVLNEYTLEPLATSEVGENLIADVLGQNAPYRRFSPVPAGAPAGAPSGDLEPAASFSEEAKTPPLKWSRVRPKVLPDVVAEQYANARSEPFEETSAYRRRARLTAAAGPPPEPEPDNAWDPVFHEAPTRILERATAAPVFLDESFEEEQRWRRSRR